MMGTTGNLIRIIPPWLLGVAVTLVGHWGDRRWFSQRSDLASGGSVWDSISVVLFANLLFLGLLPTMILDFIQPMIPFTGARAGLAVALLGFLFGLVPARLLDAPRTGWDRAFWLLLIDFLRLGGALTLIGWLLVI